MPRTSDPELYGSTRYVAQMLQVTPQRITQYVLDEGLPKDSRDRFYLPDVVNWEKVRILADWLKMKPQELSRFGFVDFSLGEEIGGPHISEKALDRIFRSNIRKTKQVARQR